MTANIMAALSRPLKPSEIDIRVAQVIYSKDKCYASFLAYKDARVDMAILDEATGGLWQNEYKRDSQGVLQCGIGIKIAEEWVWKWSNGTTSNVESEKGEYSDAFKRAGFMWGIGRQLYNAPKLFTSLKDDEFYTYQEKEKTKAKASNSLRPNEWTWTFSDDLQTVKAVDKSGQFRINVTPK